MPKAIALDEALAKDILKEMVLDHPDVFADWVPVRDLSTEILHQWDRMRLDEKYGTDARAYALLLAMKATPWLECRGEGVENFEARYRRGAPDFKPKDYPNALLEIQSLRVSMRSWKELAAVTWDLTKKLQNAWATVEDVNQRLVSTLAAVVFYRQQCIELRARLETMQKKVSAPLDPTKVQIKALVTDAPSEMLEISKIVPIHKLLAVEEKHA